MSCETGARARIKIDDSLTRCSYFVQGSTNRVEIGRISALPLRHTEGSVAPEQRRLHLVVGVLVQCR
jgi:hypothetical protein